MEHFKKEKIAAKKTAQIFKKQVNVTLSLKKIKVPKYNFLYIHSANVSPLPQVVELRSQSQQLEDEKEMLSDKNAENIADMEKLKHQLAELMKENERREAFSSDEKNKVNGLFCDRFVVVMVS